MPKIEPFEKYTNRYEEWFDKNRFVYESEVAAVKRFILRKGTGIEIGIGSGRFAKPLEIKYGVEPSPEMGKLARKLGIKVTEGVAENLLFEDEKFDFALMVTTICFLDDVEKAFKEAYRIIKPSGVIIIGFVDKNSPVGKLYEKYKDENVFYRIAKFYSVKEVVDNLKRTGFKNFEFVSTVFQKLEDIKKIEAIKDGFSEGSFVVVKRIK